MTSSTDSDPLNGTACKRWGQTFQWTDKHIPKEEITSLRAHYDELGSAVLERLQAIVSKQKADDPDVKSPAKVDYYNILRENYQDDEVLGRFWDELHEVPEWVDWEQIERGQKFFARYAVANCTAYGLQGFVRENAGIAEVFARTGGFAIKNLLKRIIETFTWMIQVTNSLPSIQPHGKGHISTIRVRLLHAIVRQRISKLAASRPEYFDMQKYGAPVNDLDSIHAMTLFCMPAWDSMPKLGIAPRKEEVDDFIALFRYISYLIGTPHEYFESAERAKAVMETTFLYELEPTPTSKVLAHNFFKWISESPIGLSKQFLEAGCRWMNGHEMSDALGAGRPGVYHYVSFLGMAIIVSVLAFLQHLVPSIDRYMVKFNRKMLYDAVTDNASFAFEYVPEVGKKGLGKDVEVKKSGGGWRPIELGLVSVFMGTCFVVFLLCLGIFKIAVSWGAGRVPGMIFAAWKF